VKCLLACIVLGTAFMLPTHAQTDDHAAHPYAKELRNADGSWKYTNKLADESSPYLRQHAHNPVDWHPWGKEAFELARKTQKPIFLSIGYSTCYWCHVMERQVFESPQLGKLMNETCINIKVDREERPDVDDIYMAAVQMLNQGRGGWPMSVFLTPPGAGGREDRGLKPFFAATYIPPQSFGPLLAQVGKVWKERKADVVAQAEQVADAIREHLSEDYTPGDVPAGLIDVVADAMLRTYDREHGGFGSAPKFPTPNNLLFLMKAYRRRPSDELWRAISHTLERMARGGMYDQLAGGFHRYSVDEKWLVPHFEKMLYDNGQLVEVYLIAQSIKPDAKDPQLYPRVVREICDYVLREMTDPTGTFWSAQDAEVDAREGDNYVWLPPQIKAAIADDKLAELAIKLYGLDLGPNFQDPHDAKAKPVNVLFLPQRLDEFAAAQKLTLEELLARRAEINRQLLAVRMKRKQPRLDDKVLTSWNGLMISGLARAGRDLQEPRYTQAAAKAAAHILAAMRTEDGGLYRTMRQGKAKIPAFLEDYAYFAAGLIELYRTDGHRKWLEAAESLTAYAARKFASEGPPVLAGGGYYDTLADQDDLFVRTRTTYDGATPSGNSVMVHNLLSLYELTKNEKHLKTALVDLRAFAAPLRRRSGGMAHMLHAAARAMELAPREFRVAGAPAAARQPTEKEPVAAAIDTSRLDLKSGSAKVTLTLRVHEKFHVNANEPGVEGLIPVTVKLEGVRGVELAVKYPAGRKKKFAFADKPVAVYEGEIVIEATLSKGKLPAAANPKLVLQWQACNDDACLLPQTLEFPLELTGLE
jgi:uncharacterized protein YyaL (SSP411 family)